MVSRKKLRQEGDGISIDEIRKKFNIGIPVSSVELINFVNGRSMKWNKVLEEFLEHNEEIKTLVRKKEYSKGTHTLYVTAR